jgi:hypothetical protein
VVLGSLAFLPAMLVFIYVVWMLILYGAAVAFIYQKLFRESVPGFENPEMVRDSLISDDREELLTDPDDDEEENEFTQMERQVLSVLAAMQAMAGELEILLPPLTPENEPRILKEANAVRAQDLANHLKESLENVDRAALPLHELGWIRRRGRGAELIYILKAESRAMDLLALHSLLVRINPKGTALLRNLNMLEEIKHTLSLLYSKSKDHPPLSLQTARGIPPT